MSARSERSRAHRVLLFEYLLGLTLTIGGLAGMAATQAQLALMRVMQDAGSRASMPAPSRPRHAVDDVRSLSPSLRVCGDGLETAMDLECWREQLGSLLAAAPATGAYQRHRLSVDGREREVLIRAGGHAAGQLSVLDADTGETLWRVDGGAVPGFRDDTATLGEPRMRSPLAARVTVVDGDRDGLADRVYAGDLAGRLWRVDLAGVPAGLPRTPDNVRHGDRSLWSATPVFTAASAPGGDGGLPFATGPDVVQAGDEHGRYDALVLGTAARAGGLSENWLYMVKDRAVISGLPPGVPREHAALRDLTADCRASECVMPGDMANGWRVPLRGGGERVSGRPVTAAGNVFFATRKGAGDTCAAGRGLHVVALRDARAVLSVPDGEDADGAARDIIGLVERAAGVPPCYLASGGG